MSTYEVEIVTEHDEVVVLNIQAACVEQAAEEARRQVESGEAGTVGREAICVEVL